MFVPDSSVPISTGTAPDLGVMQTPDTPVATQDTVVDYPEPQFQPDNTVNPVYTPREATIPKAVWGGMMQTAWAAALMANDMPTFQSIPTYDANADLDAVELDQQYQLPTEDRDYLLKSGSPQEFAYRRFQLDEKRTGLLDMAARPGWGMLGATADVDLALGYGLGLASKAAKLNKAATLSTLTAGTAIGTTGTYVAAGDKSPYNTVDAATHVALSSSLAFLYATGFKYKQPLPKVLGFPEPPIPAAAPKVDVPLSTPGTSPGKRVTDSPETATDDDILEAIEDIDD